jgi:hypothetical protein
VVGAAFRQPSGETDRESRRHGGGITRDLEPPPLSPSAAEAEKNLEAKLVTERVDIEAPGTQLRVALEFLRALSDSKPKPSPQPNHNNNKGFPGKPKGSF